MIIKYQIKLHIVIAALSTMWGSQGSSDEIYGFLPQMNHQGCKWQLLLLIISYIVKCFHIYKALSYKLSCMILIRAQREW